MQHLLEAMVLYRGARGEPADAQAAYLHAYCNTFAGDLVISVLEQGLFGDCGARAMYCARSELGCGRAARARDRAHCPQANRTASTSAPALRPCTR